jgi:hypothetical protein
MSPICTPARTLGGHLRSESHIRRAPDRAHGAGDAADCEFGCYRVERTMPPVASDRNIGGSQAIYGRKRKAFRFSVIPPQPGEKADILGNLLLHVESEAILEGPVASS